MTTSTDGQICYGIHLERYGDDGDLKLPWETDDDNDLNGWWRETVHGFHPSVEVYSETDPSGYIGGKKPDDVTISRYFKERNDWDKAHPCPVEMVNCCSGEYAMWILAISREGMALSANRGYPEVFDPSKLVATEDDKSVLLDFCVKHNIDIGNSRPAWYLSSYWG